MPVEIMTERLALYTTVYPGVEKYLSNWYNSVLLQTDCNFDIWIGVDGLDPDMIVAAMGGDPSPTWVLGAEGDSPAQIRQAAIKRMVQEYPAVVFVDSDDLLFSTRVEAARKSLLECDVAGCAMRIIDESGNCSDHVFGPRDALDLAKWLPRNNAFGLSNTAYRSQVLVQCMPIPEDCVLIDWYIATRAWISEARFCFDPTCRMKYRQYPGTVAQVLAPFALKQVILATECVLSHYRCVLGTIPELGMPWQNVLTASQVRAEAFHASISISPSVLSEYVSALNQLPLNNLWWGCVADPRLEEIWKPS